VAVKSRIDRIEGKLRDNQKAPIEYAVVNVNVPEADERLKKAKEEYMTKYGCLSGLRIIRTRVPEPKPLPAAFK
jgi:hypothetical protein